MKAMILAAGLGTRMRPLTDRMPKPLLEAGGKSLLHHLLGRLEVAGVNELVINVSWFGEMIEQALGDGSGLGVSIRYSEESSPLETAGGIVRALPLLGDDPFLVVNGDIWTDYGFASLVQRDMQDMLAHLVLVANPGHNRAGDFGLDEDGQVLSEFTGEGYTFSGISILSPQLFSGLDESAGRLAPVLRKAMEKGAVTGEVYQGQWWDIGTPERLEQLDRFLSGERQE